VQLVLQPLTEGGVGDVSLKAGTLTGPGGAQIAAENISWSPVVLVRESSILVATEHSQASKVRATNGDPLPLQPSVFSILHSAFPTP